MTTEQKQALEKATAILSDHFDHAILIACSDPADCTSVSPGLCWDGFGNWYAHKGMISERLEHISNQNLANELDGGDDGGEEKEAWQKE